MTPGDMEAVLWRLERDVSGSRAAALGTINVGQRDLRALLKAYQEQRRALERLSALTPETANATTARDLHLTVKAIADTALNQKGDER
jgi:hypothetical protein